MAMLVSETQIAALRKSERERFGRWFVETPYGKAYIDRTGRPRRVTEQELLTWRTAADARIEEMLVDLPKHACLRYSLPARSPIS
jgi:hypothetical protein